MVMQLKDRLAAGDIVVDGGNSYFKDDVRRAKSLREKEIKYMDAGTSGGTWGLERGYCLMVGGDEQSFRHLEPIFSTLAPGVGSVIATPRATPGATPGKPKDETGQQKNTVDKGYLYCGPVGSGHFVKMVHNGIEYGLMQAFAEGFNIFERRRLR